LCNISIILLTPVKHKKVQGQMYCIASTKSQKVKVVGHDLTKLSHKMHDNILFVGGNFLSYATIYVMLLGIIQDRVKF